MTGEGMDGANQTGSLDQADNHGGTNESGIDVVLVTGLSGAGRGTAAKVLEDLGWDVADNLPPQLITRMVDLGLDAGSRITQLAIVMDVRSRGFTGDLDWVRNDLATRNITPQVVFMEASDDMLVRRYEQNRRSHPLQGEQTLAEGIAAERDMLAPVRATADLIIDTSTLSVRELRESIERASGGETVANTSVTVESFGFKYGLPMDADTVMDVRFLPNPHWIDDLRPHTGQHPAVRDYVLGQTGAAEFLETYHRLLSLIVDGYRREGKRYMTVAIGCTGGKHRSVALAEAVAQLLESDKTLTMAALRAGCAANSTWCLQATCEWRWPPWLLTARTGDSGRRSCNIGSAAVVLCRGIRSATCCWPASMRCSPIRLPRSTNSAGSWVCGGGCCRCARSR